MKNLTLSSIQFQSTHPRRVRHMAIILFSASINVSIHAPTQGATSHCHSRHLSSKSFNPRTHAGCDSVPSGLMHSHNVSIHAPTQGATKQLSKLCFSSVVSIHAPTQGATQIEALIDKKVSVSIHAPTQGATNQQRLASMTAEVSIHAPTQGATSVGLAGQYFPVCFNPRTHAGCDLRCGTPQKTCMVSIHAPAQGATSST